MKTKTILPVTSIEFHKLDTQFKFQELLMLSVIRILHLFSLVGVHSSVAIYVIFMFNPMHVLSLGISRLFKECLINVLDDTEATINTFKSKSDTLESFKQVEIYVLSKVNIFLKI